MKDYKRTKEFKALRQSLLDNLHERGLDTQCYEDKVDEYMDFWVRRKELREDIRTRGFTVKDERGRESENRSLSLEVQVSRQMLAIFTTLGFREDALRGGGGDRLHPGFGLRRGAHGRRKFPGRCGRADG